MNSCTRTRRITSRIVAAAGSPPRLVSDGAGAERLALPEEPDWVLAPDPDGVFDKPFVQTLPARQLEPNEVRVQVEAAGLNFWDGIPVARIHRGGHARPGMCGHVLEAGSDVSGVSPGDHVVGMGFGAFGGEMITHGELVAPAPDGFSVSELATIPSAYVSAALSFEFTGLEAGERVLNSRRCRRRGPGGHPVGAGRGSGGVRHRQRAQAGLSPVAGREIRFDSRTTAFGEEILKATGGEGVDVVLNSLTSEGYIDASLACLKQGGRFVEMARRDILSEEEMAAVRPDVPYHILELDVLKKTEPARVGKVLAGRDGARGGGRTQADHTTADGRWPKRAPR